MVVSVSVMSSGWSSVRCLRNRMGFRLSVVWPWLFSQTRLGPGPPPAGVASARGEEIGLKASWRLFSSSCARGGRSSLGGCCLFWGVAGCSRSGGDGRGAGLFGSSAVRWSRPPHALARLSDIFTLLPVYIVKVLQVTQLDLSRAAKVNSSSASCDRYGLYSAI
jgi:hypothetical protein